MYIIQIISTERITVFTDTASSITPEEAKEKGIGLVSVKIIVGDKEFDESTLPPKELYKILGKKRITTTAPNPEEIYEKFQSYYNLGGRKFLFISLSPQTSSIYPNAYNASQEFQKNNPDSEIKVINSKGLCFAQSFKVDEAQRLINDGLYLKDVVSGVEKLTGNIVLYCSGNKETAQFIKDSGRVHGVDRIKANIAATVSSASSFIPSLSIVPILTMNSEDGRVMAGIVRGNEDQGIREMVNRVYKESEIRKQQPSKFAIAYTKDEEVGFRVRDFLSRRFDITDSNLIKPKEAGTPLAVHAGPRIAVLSAIWN